MPQTVRRRLATLRHRHLYKVTHEVRGRLERLEANPPSSGLHGTYVGDGQMLISTTWGGRLLIPADDRSLMPELVSHGTYDVPFTAFVQRHVRPGDVAVDVGANVGLFTLLLAYQVWETGRVIAYEANPQLVPTLRENVAMNWLGDRVEIVPHAAAATSGRVEMRVPESFRMLGTIQASDEVLLSGQRGGSLKTFEVETEPLDNRLARLERVALIKVDVEGAEEKAFAGMAGLLDAGVVERVCFEMIRPWMGDDWAPFVKRLKAFEAAGWRFATLPDSGVPEAAELDALLDRGWSSQVLMTSASLQA